MALTVTLVSAEEEVWHGEASLVVAKTDAAQTGSSGGAETRPRNAATNYVISYL